MTDLEEAVSRIRRWGEVREWRGYDPYDALNSPFAGTLTLGTVLGRRLLTQAVKLSPVNPRPLLRIHPEWNAKALALVASAYARLAAADDADALARREALRWLDRVAACQVNGAWGYHFPVQTRIFRYARGTPNAIATSFAAHALLEGASLLGEERHVLGARKAALFACRQLYAVGPHGPFFRYLPGEEELVHNANVLVASFVRRAAVHEGDDGLAERAAAAVATTVAAQRRDGSWPYAEQAGHDWVDNFHTAYVLEALASFTDDGAVASALERGLDFWQRELFLPDGTPRYDARRTLPDDAHSYSAAIETWLAVGERSRAERMAGLLVERMLDPRGFVHFQRRRLWTSRVPYIRWTTAPAFRALAGVLLAGRHADLG